MTPARLSVRQPIFIASIVILIITLGAISLKRLPIDLFPDVTFPTIMVMTTYPGAGPLEVESSVSRILEDEVSSISGVQKVSSTNREGVSTIAVEFDLKQNLDYAEQQVRAKVTNALRLLPDDVDQPVVRKISPSDAPILGIALQANLPDAELYDLAKEIISPQFEQVPQVGQVDILGGRKREIHVKLDRNRLVDTDIAASAVAAALASGGRNIPVGKIDSSTVEYSYRTLAEYKTIADIKNTVLRVADVEHPITIGRLGTVEDSLQDEVSRTRLNGEKALLFNIFRQSGSNTVRVADMVAARVEKLNKDYEKRGEKIQLKIVNDMSRRIKANVDDVYESIFFGVLLTIIVVYFFLGSLKSTLITGFALPNSLLGACIAMAFFGFSINIMSLLAMSLVVGLLVDDAIVVRENIFRKLEAGMSPKQAAVIGTEEVTLAVIATTLTILAVFGPIGNLEGIVGQFFKQFGLTVCFAMLVSLFDGLLVAPALSAYAAGGHDAHAVPSTRFGKWNKSMLQGFDRFQTWLEHKYESLLRVALRHPLKTLASAVGIFIASIVIARFVPFTFLPPQDNGEFFVQFELPAGASLDATDKVAADIEKNLRAQHPEIEDLLTTIGSGSSESNKGSIFIRLVPSKKRSMNTTQAKDAVREGLKDFTPYNIIVTDQSSAAGGARAFNLNIVGQDLDTLVPYSEKVLEKLKTFPALRQADTSHRVGKPEYQIALKPEMAVVAGVTVTTMGNELRTLVEGQKQGVYREKGIDYDVRVRLQDDQRDLKNAFQFVRVPNVNNRLIPLTNVATLKEAQGPTTIQRENRSRYIQLSADLVPGGAGIGGAITEMNRAFGAELTPPPGVTYSFVGEAERFAELMTNMVVSLGLGMMFIYLVLASLYGSFVTPYTIMLVIPLAACGAFIALFITHSSFDLFSMIGCVMLMGLATKNSILLIDFAVEKHKQGATRVDSLLEAGRTRLRPIIMTSLALIAGMVPVAIGLNEASKQRTSLGIVVIGGTISSTVLTLVVIPAAHIYVDRFQEWLLVKYRRVFGHDESNV